MNAMNPTEYIKKLELENLKLKIDVTKANLAGFQQSVMFAMEKIPQLQAKLQEYEAELARIEQEPS